MRIRDLINIVEAAQNDIRGDVANVAQHIYDQWDVNDDPYEEWGNGGICHRIAYALLDRVDFDGDAFVTSVEEPVPHTFVVVSANDGTYRVDIPYRHYETFDGEGFAKIEGVTFTSDMVEIEKISDDPDLAYEMADDENP